MRLMPRFCLFPLIAIPLLAAAPSVPTSYTPYRFAAAEGWTLSSAGDRGESRLEGSRLVLDFTHGATWIAITPPDRVLLGTPVRLRVRLRTTSGSLAAHPVRLHLFTHFMTFHKAIAAAGDDLVFDAPPGPGWQWMRGENDGKLHGPLRTGELRFEANGARDRVELLLESITADVTVPPGHMCVLTGSATAREFTAEVRCLGEAPRPVHIAYTLRDWDGRELAAGTRDLTIPPAGVKAIATVPSPDPSRAFVEAEFKLVADGQVAPDAHAYFTAAPEAHGDAKVDASSPFGMGVYLGRFNGPELDRAAGMARDAGVKWVREDIRWSRIQPTRDRYDWIYYDHLVETATRNGISIYGLVSGFAPWTEAYTERGIDDYLVFLRQLVRRYRSTIHHWEIWNEPNIFFWQGPKELYGTLLRKAYAAVKAEAPEAQVLGMSTAGIDYNFIARTMARDAPFDILTIHPYRKQLDERQLARELQITRDLVGGRPVWITEFGWATFAPHNSMAQDFPPFTERAQAELLARAYLACLISGVKTNISWYDYRNDGEDPHNFEHNMGVLRRDFTVKPAYRAYATLTGMLQGHELAEEVKLPDSPGVLAYRFEGKSGSVIAIWSPEADAKVRLPLPAKSAKLTNAMGESRELDVAQELTLHAGAPIYLTFK